MMFNLPHDDNKGGDQNKNERLPSNVEIIEYSTPDTQRFSEEIREGLIIQTKKIIDTAQSKVGKSLNWVVQFFPPESVETLKKYRENIFDKMFIKDEDMKALEDAGLRLSGLSVPVEEENRAIQFLADREMEKRGEKKSRTEGYLILGLNEKQVTITTDSYSLKYGGEVNLEDVIKYLTNTTE